MVLLSMRCKDFHTYFNLKTIVMISYLSLLFPLASHTFPDSESMNAALGSAQFISSAGCCLSASVPMVFEALQEIRLPLPGSVGIFASQQRLLNIGALFINNLLMLVITLYQNGGNIALYAALLSYSHVLHITYAILRVLVKNQPQLWTEKRSIGIFAIHYINIFCSILSLYLSGDAKLAVFILRDFSFCTFITVNVLLWVRFNYELFRKFKESNMVFGEWMKELHYTDKSAIGLALSMWLSNWMGFLFPWILDSYPQTDPFNIIVSSDVKVQMAICITKTIGCMLSYIVIGRVYREASFQEQKQIESQRQMIAFISHEMRTPISILAAGLEVIHIMAHSNTVDRKQLEEISKDLRSTCLAAGEVLDDLSMYETILYKAVPVQLVRTNFNEDLKALVQSFNIIAERSGVLLLFETKVIVPRAMLDWAKVSHVLKCLISNAIKYSPGGRVTVIASILDQTHQAGSHRVKTRRSMTTVVLPMNPLLEVCVLDTGIGMTAQEIKQLFDYAQLFKRKAHPGKGRGFNLWSAGELVKVMNGTLTCGSPGLNMGCEFAMTIPCSLSFDDSIHNSDKLISSYEDLFEHYSQLKKEASSFGNGSDNVLGIASRTVSKDGPALGHPKFGVHKFKQLDVLIVDDSKTNRKMMERLIISDGHNTFEADDGDTAVAAVEARMHEKQSFDVILLDNEMPRMKGTDAARKMRELGFCGIILGVTGNTLTSDIEEFRACGVDRVLSKPLTLPVFKSAYTELASVASTVSDRSKPLNQQNMKAYVMNQLLPKQNSSSFSKFSLHFTNVPQDDRIVASRSNSGSLIPGAAGGDN